VFQRGNGGEVDLASDGDTWSIPKIGFDNLERRRRLIRHSTLPSLNASSE
jgi:hypothetical protein